MDNSRCNTYHLNMKQYQTNKLSIGESVPFVKETPRELEVRKVSHKRKGSLKKKEEFVFPIEHDDQIIIEQNIKDMVFIKFGINEFQLELLQEESEE